MKNAYDYRYDYRSQDQFIDDILEATKIENYLMSLYVAWLNKNRKSKSLYYFEDYGVNNSGEFIEDPSKVNCKADFLLKRYNHSNRKIDIKFARKEHSRFHLKVRQVKKYLKDDVCIINFMGVDTSNIRFCILKPIELKDWLENAQRCNMWHQECIRIPCKAVKWNYV